MSQMRHKHQKYHIFHKIANFAIFLNCSKMHKIVGNAPQTCQMCIECVFRAFEAVTRWSRGEYPGEVTRKDSQTCAHEILCRGNSAKMSNFDFFEHVLSASTFHNGDTHFLLLYWRAGVFAVLMTPGIPAKEIIWLSWRLRKVGVSGKMSKMTKMTKMSKMSKMS